MNGKNLSLRFVGKSRRKVKKISVIRHLPFSHKFLGLFVLALFFNVNAAISFSWATCLHTWLQIHFRIHLTNSFFENSCWLCDHPPSVNRCIFPPVFVKVHWHYQTGFLILFNSEAFSPEMWSVSFCTTARFKNRSGLRTWAGTFWWGRGFYANLHSVFLVMCPA